MKTAITAKSLRNTSAHNAKRLGKTKRVTPAFAVSVNAQIATRARAIAKRLLPQAKTCAAQAARNGEYKAFFVLYRDVPNITSTHIGVQQALVSLLRKAGLEAEYAGLQTFEPSHTHTIGVTILW